MLLHIFGPTTVQGRFKKQKLKLKKNHQYKSLDLDLFHWNLRRSKNFLPASLS